MELAKRHPENNYVGIEKYSSVLLRALEKMDKEEEPLPNLVFIRMDAENLEKVLDKFFQEDFHKSGSGLGLAISNEIVKLHGGEINIESKKNVGTTITFTLKNKLIEMI